MKTTTATRSCIQAVKTRVISASLTFACISSQAQGVATNLVAYNFDTNQVTGISSPFGGGTIWSGSGGDFVSVQWDSTTDASNNPASGSMLLTVNCNGDQFILWDGITPWYSPLPLQGSVVFTNLSWDMRYDGRSAIRTNTAAAGVYGSQGPGSLDFGYMRVGTTGSGYSQDWYYYWSIPATNGLGLPNTNWIHMSVDLSSINDSTTSAIQDTMFGMYDAAFGNNVLKGFQYLWFDNITYSGYIATPAGPRMAIKKTIPALRMFGGTGAFGRSQLTMADNNESWIGGPFPVSYSITLLGNAGNFPATLDTHIQIIQGNDNYSGFDYTAANTFWLQILSTSSNACTATVQWKTNFPDSLPANTVLAITNPVRAGTWTLTFLSDTNGTLTTPGAAPVPFNLGILQDVDVIADFGSPVQVRFGIQNNGNTENGGLPDDWASIGVSGTAGLGGTNYTEDFTKKGTDQLDTNFWNLATSDGADMQVLVPTNAPYWITWTTPDTGFYPEVATNLTGPWVPFNNCFGCPIPEQSLHAGQEWLLILQQSLPTANGLSGGPLFPNAYFRLSTTP